MNVSYGSPCTYRASASKLSRILVAVEDPLEALNLEDILAARGYGDVTLTTDLRKVAAFLERRAFDLLILDMHSVFVDSTDVLRQLPKTAYMARLEILAIINTGHEPSRLNALVAGAYDTLERPYAVADVVAKVDAVLAPLSGYKML